MTLHYIVSKWLKYPSTTMFKWLNITALYVLFSISLTLQSYILPLPLPPACRVSPSGRRQSGVSGEPPGHRCHRHSSGTSYSTPEVTGSKVQIHIVMKRKKAPKYIWEKYARWPLSSKFISVGFFQKFGKLRGVMLWFVTFLVRRSCQ